MNATPLALALRERLPRWKDRSLDQLARSAQGQDAAILAALGNNLSEAACTPQAQKTYEDCLHRLETPREPVALAQLNPASIRQGAHPDCVLTSTAIGLAHERPLDVLRLVSPGEQGLELQLPGQQPRPVAAPSDYDLIHHSCAYEGGTWMTVLARELGPVGQHLRGRAIGALTGNSSDTDQLWLSSEAGVRKKVKQTLDDHGVVLAARTGFAPEVSGLKTRHCYAVLDYDPWTDRLSLQDPEGNEPLSPTGEPLDGTADGRFTLKLSEFKSSFSTVTCEQRERRKSGTSQGKGHLAQA